MRHPLNDDGIFWWFLAGMLCGTIVANIGWLLR